MNFQQQPQFSSPSAFGSGSPDPSMPEFPKKRKKKNAFLDMSEEVLAQMEQQQNKLPNSIFPKSQKQNDLSPMPPPPPQQQQNEFESGGGPSGGVYVTVPWNDEYNLSLFGMKMTPFQWIMLAGVSGIFFGSYFLSKIGIRRFYSSSSSYY